VRPSRAFLLSFSTCVITCSICVSAAAQDASYKASVEKWRQDYENDLKSDHGWLTIAGLFWLHEGENRFGSSAVNDIVLPEPAPADAGYFVFHGGKITAHVNPGVTATIGGKPITTADMKPDSPDGRIMLGDLALWVHQSGDRYAIRLRDPNSKVRASFTGLHWFPIDQSYCATAKYVPYERPKPVEIQNLAGDALKLPISGYVAFTLHGLEYRLEAQTEESGGLTFVFRDLTAGKETYPASRFLDTEPPKNGEVVLDFNEAYNPPCAYNPYTTCPLPPPDNRLKVRIAAGEMAYRHDH
jgi:uncharacterized protein